MKITGFPIRDCSTEECLKCLSGFGTVLEILVQKQTKSNGNASLRLDVQFRGDGTNQNPYKELNGCKFHGCTLFAHKSHAEVKNISDPFKYYRQTSGSSSDDVITYLLYNKKKNIIHQYSDEMFERHSPEDNIVLEDPVAFAQNASPPESLPKIETSRKPPPVTIRMPSFHPNQEKHRPNLPLPTYQADIDDLTPELCGNYRLLHANEIGVPSRTEYHTPHPLPLPEYYPNHHSSAHMYYRNSPVLHPSTRGYRTTSPLVSYTHGRYFSPKHGSRYAPTARNGRRHPQFLSRKYYETSQRAYHYSPVVLPETWADERQHSSMYQGATPSKFFL